MSFKSVHSFYWCFELMNSLKSREYNITLVKVKLYYWNEGYDLILWFSESTYKFQKSYGKAVESAEYIYNTFATYNVPNSRFWLRIFLETCWRKEHLRHMWDLRWLHQGNNTNLFFVIINIKILKIYNRIYFQFVHDLLY